MPLLSSADSFQTDLFQKGITGTLSVSNGSNPEVLPVLIWVQTVCKSYQQTTKVAAIAREELTHYLLLSSVDNFCKQFRPRSGPTKMSGLIRI